MAGVTEDTTGMWSLVVKKKGMLTNSLDEMVIWSGPKNTSPSAAEMARVVPVNIQPTQLASLAMQMVQVYTVSHTLSHPFSRLLTHTHK